MENPLLRIHSSKIISIFQKKKKKKISFPFLIPKWLSVMLQSSHLLAINNEKNIPASKVSKIIVDHQT